jgi:hypothetical protein
MTPIGQTRHSQLLAIGVVGLVIIVAACQHNGARFDRLRPGMSETEVQSLVGKPSEVSGPPVAEQFAPPPRDERCPPGQVAKLWIYEGKAPDGLSPFVYFDSKGRVACVRTVAYLNPVQRGGG